jgi:hypothetical protein
VSPDDDGRHHPDAKARLAQEMTELLAVLGTRLTGSEAGSTGSQCEHPGLFGKPGPPQDPTLFDYPPAAAGSAGVASAGVPQECRICPVCLAIRALRNARPEVVEHLEIATTNLLAAARAVLAPSRPDAPWDERTRSGAGAGAPAGARSGAPFGAAFQAPTRRPPTEHIDITE